MNADEASLGRQESLKAKGIASVEDFTQSRIYQEIAGIGRREGRLEGEAKATLRLLTRRCGTLSPATTARIEALPLEQLEANG